MGIIGVDGLMVYNAFEKLDSVESVVRRHLKDNIVCRDSTTYLEYLILKEYYLARPPKIDGSVYKMITATME